MRLTPAAFTTEIMHPCRCALLRDLRMILLTPCGLVLAKKAKELSAPDFAFSSLDQERCAFPRPHQGIDLFGQLRR